MMCGGRDGGKLRTVRLRFGAAAGLTAAVLTASLAAMAVTAPAIAFAAPQLYETGPAADAALVRFVNGTAQPITVVSDDAGHPQLTIAPAAPITDYRGTRSTTPMTGTWQQGSDRVRVDVTAKAAGTTSIVAWRQAGGALVDTAFQESSSFDGLHASLAFYVVDAQCLHAGLVAAPKPVAIFEDRPVGSVSRRGLNAVKLSVQAVCGGQPTGPVLDLGQLQLGTRYSVFLVPGSAGSRLLGAQDRIGH